MAFEDFILILQILGMLCLLPILLLSNYNWEKTGVSIAFCCILLHFVAFCCILTNSA